MAQSYNGWPASADPNHIDVNRNFGVLVGAPPFREGGFAGGIKDGDVSVIFAYLVKELDKIEPMLVKDGNKGYGCWGYQYRANVNNPSTLSCHASATAIDYNAPNHANGTSTGPNGGGGWSASEYSKVQTVLGFLEGVIRWLTGNDPMHFEIRGSTSDIKRVADKIRNSLKPPQPEPAPEDEVTPDECRKIVQEELKKFFSTDVIKVAGDEMQEPENYDSTRDKLQMRILRVSSIGAASQTGREID